MIYAFNILLNWIISNLCDRDSNMHYCGMLFLFLYMPCSHSTGFHVIGHTTNQIKSRKDAAHSWSGAVNPVPDKLISFSE